MNLSTEQQNELAHFPQALRALIQAELAAGNSITELGHSHPAPPAGAYFKLAHRVSTRPRASGNGLDFRERNSSLSSGEFTDEKRFYFVVEPPNPPPPEPDMDVIRRASENTPAPVIPPASSPAVSINRQATGVPASSTKNTPARTRPPATAPAARESVATVETPTGRSHLLHFCDQRPPQEVQFALERELTTPFTAVMEDDRLGWRATAQVNGTAYRFQLRFVAALPNENRYSLLTEVSWADENPATAEYIRKSSTGWIQMWTRELIPASPPPADRGGAERYRALCRSALQAEAHLDSVAAVQQAVVAGLKQGGRFTTSHKEGGTNISWRANQFVRADHGDYPDLKSYADEAEFLRFLRQYYDFKIASHAGKGSLSELSAWKLILRMMFPQ